VSHTYTNLEKQGLSTTHDMFWPVRNPDAARQGGLGHRRRNPNPMAFRRGYMTSPASRAFRRRERVSRVVETGEGQLEYVAVFTNRSTRTDGPVPRAVPGCRAVPSHR